MGAYKPAIYGMYFYTTSAARRIATLRVQQISFYACAHKHEVITFHAAKFERRGRRRQETNILLLMALSDFTSYYKGKYCMHSDAVYNKARTISPTLPVNSYFSGMHYGRY